MRALGIILVRRRAGDRGLIALLGARAFAGWPVDHRGHCGGQAEVPPPDVRTLALTAWHPRLPCPPFRPCAMPFSASRYVSGKPGNPVPGSSDVLVIPRVHVIVCRRII